MTTKIASVANTPVAKPIDLEYTVKSGDTLTKIAEIQYGVSRYSTVQIHAVTEALAQSNHLSNPNLIYVGKKLELPEVSIPYPSGTTQIVMQQSAVVYTLGTVIVAEPVYETQIVYVSPVDRHLKRNQDMNCPTALPPAGDDWDESEIWLNPVSIYFHGYGNTDVRGKGENAGMQCIYTPDGQLVSGELAGTRDYAPPIDPETGDYTFARVWDHTWKDVVPEIFMTSEQP